MKSMTIDQALAIVSQVCADFRGTLDDHKRIQQALQVIEQALQANAQPVVEQQTAKSGAARQK